MRVPWMEQMLDGLKGDLKENQKAVLLGKYLEQRLALITDLWRGSSSETKTAFHLDVLMAAMMAAMSGLLKVVHLVDWKESKRGNT